MRKLLSIDAVVIIVCLFILATIYIIEEHPFTGFNAYYYPIILPLEMNKGDALIINDVAIYAEVDKTITGIDISGKEVTLKVLRHPTIMQSLFAE